jgi:GT2 family glycosyltransferase
MPVSLVIPSYRRPDRLARCIDAALRQGDAVAEILVVHRPDDLETTSLVRRQGVRSIQVDRPGAIAAMAMGIQQATGDLIGILDDDVEIPNSWSTQLSAHMGDPHVGAAGGRDRVHVDGRPIEAPRRARVGEVQAFGRVIGNHHLGAGPARQVDVLKGCNLLMRRAAFPGFDSRLRGQGAQVHWELALCLAMRRAGWALVYDPAVEVQHFPGPRFDADQRAAPSSAAIADAAYNETLALLEHLSPARRALFWAWALAIGSAGGPGLLQAVRAGKSSSVVPTIRGRLAARREHRGSTDA